MTGYDNPKAWHSPVQEIEIKDKTFQGFKIISRFGLTLPFWTASKFVTRVDD